MENFSSLLIPHTAIKTWALYSGSKPSHLALPLVLENVVDCWHKQQDSCIARSENIDIGITRAAAALWMRPDARLAAKGRGHSVQISKVQRHFFFNYVLGLKMPLANLGITNPQTWYKTSFTPPPPI